MNALEIAAGALVVLSTGAAGYWGRYVTSGASKAQKLAVTVEEIQRTVKDHEEREERKFEEVGRESIALREAVGELIGSVGVLHGKVDALSQFIRNGGRKE